jgi:hypothetical protein
MAYGTINSGNAWTSADRDGADNCHEPVRGNVVANSFFERSLGGSRAIALRDGGGYVDIPEFKDFTIPHARYTGHTWQVVVETRVGNAGITVTPKVRRLNNTPADLVTGSASSSVAGDADGEIWATQTLSVSLSAGDIIRVMGVKSADTYDAWMVATIRRSGT